MRRELVGDAFGRVTQCRNGVPDRSGRFPLERPELSRRALIVADACCAEPVFTRAESWAKDGTSRNCAQKAALSPLYFAHPTIDATINSTTNANAANCMARVRREVR